MDNNTDNTNNNNNNNVGNIISTMNNTNNNTTTTVGNITNNTSKSSKNKTKLILIFLLLILIIVGCIIYKTIYHPSSNNTNANTSAETDKNTNTDYNPDSDAYKYYSENSKIIKIENAKDPNNLLTESEALNLLREKGFYAEPSEVKYSLSIDGEYISEQEVDENSSDRHPMYEYIYAGEISYWNITIIGKTITAFPFSYLLENDDIKTEIFVSETESVTGYDNEEGKFYINIPNKSIATIKVVDEITPETLDKVDLK